MKRIWVALAVSSNCQIVPTELGGECGDCEMGCCLRVENGVLQQLECGVWTDVPGQPAGGFFGQPQPGAGSGVPVPGACQTYHAQIAANSQWVSPATVSTGDTIELIGVQGATNDPDASVAIWRCPDGEQFFAGACVGFATTVSTDPLPASNHLRLIVKIGSTYYDILGSVFTVPGGHTNDQVILQVNDSNLTNNSGTLTCDVEVCYNANPTWTHSFDFAINPGPFTPWLTNAVWISGVGWSNVATSGASETAIVSTLPATINYISFVLNNTQTVTAPQHNDILSGVFATTLLTQSVVAGVQTVIWSGAAFTDKFGLNAYNSAVAGNLVITHCTITGTGVDPF